MHLNLPKLVYAYHHLISSFKFTADEVMVKVQQVREVEMDFEARN